MLVVLILGTFDRIGEFVEVKTLRLATRWFGDIARSPVSQRREIAKSSQTAACANRDQRGVRFDFRWRQLPPIVGAADEKNCHVI